MSPTQAPIDEDELMALIDGVLDADRARWIEQQARQDAALAATLASLRAQRQILRAGFDDALHEPIPQRLLQTGLRPRFALPRVAAAAAWLAVGVFVGILASASYLSRDVADGMLAAGTAAAPHIDAPDLPRFVHQAAVAYAVFAPDVRHPVELGSTDAEALNAWLSQRLRRPIRAPDLSRQHFSLVGGRLLPAEIGKPAAQFMYEDRAGRRITVYLRGMAQPTPETAFRFAEHGSVKTFYWVEGDWGYALSGESSRAQLLDIARAIHERLSMPVDSNTPTARTPI